MKPRYTDAFWGKHPFDEEIILYKIKNKNKNKNKNSQLVIIQLDHRIQTANRVSDYSLLCTNLNRYSPRFTCWRRYKSTNNLC